MGNTPDEIKVRSEGYLNRAIREYQPTRLVVGRTAWRRIRGGVPRSKSKLLLGVPIQWAEHVEGVEAPPDSILLLGPDPEDAEAFVVLAKVTNVR